MGLTAMRGPPKDSMASRTPRTASTGPMLTMGFDGQKTIASALSSASANAGDGRAASAPSNRTPVMRGSQPRRTK